VRIDDFFDAQKKLKIYVKWQTPLNDDQISAIVINFGEINFSETILANKRQKSTTEYYIDFVTKGDSDGESIERVLLAGRICREAILSTPHKYFDCESINVQKLSLSSPETSAAGNICAGRMVVEIECYEHLTIGGAHREQISGAYTAITANGGNYQILQDW
jgi:hypothetical protein